MESKIKYVTRNFKNNVFDYTVILAYITVNRGLVI
jgi:hypothetical protein